MGAPSPPLRRRPPERVAAWVVTGPPGHLWSAAADLTCYACRALRASAHRRVRRRATE